MIWSYLRSLQSGLSAISWVEPRLEVPFRQAGARLYTTSFDHCQEHRGIQPALMSLRAI